MLEKLKEIENGGLEKMNNKYVYFDNNKTAFISKNKNDTTYIVFKLSNFYSQKYNQAINNYIYNIGGEIVSVSMGTGNSVVIDGRTAYVLKLPKDAPYINTFQYAITDYVEGLDEREKEEYKKLLEEDKLK